jgi:hypothetical protein
VKEDPEMLEVVLGHLSRLLAANLNVARVFVPTMSTITQVVSADLPQSAQGAIGTQ